MSQTSQSPAPRKKHHMRVSFGPEGPFYKGLTLDLSNTGMFLSTFHRFQPGQKLRLLLETPVGDLFMEGRVIWACDETHPARSTHKQGLGIELQTADGSYDPYQDFLHMI